MAIVRTIHVGGKDIPMRASALIPRLYRVKFGRDLIRDMKKLEKDHDAVKSGENESMPVEDLTIFEDVAYMMAKHADSTIPSDPDEWLDDIPGVLSIYEALPQMIDLYSENLKQTSSPAKK